MSSAVTGVARGSNSLNTPSTDILVARGSNSLNTPSTDILDVYRRLGSMPSTVLVVAVVTLLMLGHQQNHEYQSLLIPSIKANISTNDHFLIQAI